MEVQSGIQQPEPRPLASPQSGANEQDELDDNQTDASGRPSADNHSKDTQPATQKDDRKVSCRHLQPVCLQCVCVWETSDEILPVCWAILGDKLCIFT